MTLYNIQVDFECRSGDIDDHCSTTCIMLSLL
jgi:hypothetical protein